MTNPLEGQYQQMPDGTWLQNQHGQWVQVPPPQPTFNPVWDGTQIEEHSKPGGYPQGPSTPNRSAEAPAPVKTSNLGRNIAIAVAAVVVLFVIIGLVSGNSNDPSGQAQPQTQAQPTSDPSSIGQSPIPPNTQPSETQSSAPAPKPTKTKPQLTTSQEQAVLSAQSYLEMGGYSKKGLIDQLSSSYGEGFPKKDAIFAVNYLHPSWKHQAVLSAESYLEMGGYSESELVDQLHSPYGEQFTLKQAQYGAHYAYTHR